MAVKNAHMVSKSYIRAWADERNVVDVIDLQDDRGYPSSYLSATVVSYGYDSEVLTRDLERDYGRIEDRGIPAIVKLRKFFSQLNLAVSMSSKTRLWVVSHGMGFEARKYRNTLVQAPKQFYWEKIMR